MLVKISIKDTKTGEEGFIQYDDDTEQRSVAWGVPDASDALRKKLQKYFINPRDFKIPVSQETDEYEVRRGVPILDIMYFELSLSTLFAKIGVKLGKEIK